MNKVFRFFYHYNKQAKKMSVHFKGKCYIVNDITCLVPCETKWSNRQPMVVMRGYAKDIVITKNAVVIR